MKESQPQDSTNVTRRTVLGGAAATAAAVAAATTGGMKASAAPTGASHPGLRALAPFEGQWEGSYQDYGEFGVRTINTVETMELTSDGLLANKATAVATGDAATSTVEEYRSLITFDPETTLYTMSVTGPDEAYTQVGTLEADGSLVFKGKNSLHPDLAQSLGLNPKQTVATRSVMSTDGEVTNFSYQIRIKGTWTEIFNKSSMRVQ